MSTPLEVTSSAGTPVEGFDEVEIHDRVRAGEVGRLERELAAARAAKVAQDERDAAAAAARSQRESARDEALGRQIDGLEATVAELSEVVTEPVTPTWRDRRLARTFLHGGILPGPQGGLDDATFFGLCRAYRSIEHLRIERVRHRADFVARCDALDLALWPLLVLRARLVAGET